MRVPGRPATAAAILAAGGSVLIGLPSSTPAAPAAVVTVFGAWA